MGCGTGKERAHLSAHAQAVLGVCDALAASGGTVISANTDEAADPQIFAQSETGELAFYFVRDVAFEPAPPALAAFRALAERHEVAAFLVTPAAADGQVPAAPRFTRLR
jgi:hypothetical protein